MKKQNQSVFNVDVSSFLSILPNLPYLRLLVTITIVFGFGIGYGLSHNSATTKQSLVIVENRHFTRAEYERLRLGISIVEAEAILDRGTEIQRSTKTRVFVWKNPDGSKINATFMDSKLIHKEQTGL